MIRILRSLSLIAVFFIFSLHGASFQAALDQLITNNPDLPVTKEMIQATFEDAYEQGLMGQRTGFYRKKPEEGHFMAHHLSFSKPYVRDTAVQKVLDDVFDLGLQVALSDPYSFLHWEDASPSAYKRWWEKAKEITGLSGTFYKTFPMYRQGTMNKTSNNNFVLYHDGGKAVVMSIYHTDDRDSKQNKEIVFRLIDVSIAGSNPYYSAFHPPHIRVASASYYFDKNNKRLAYDNGFFYETIFQ